MNMFKSNVDGKEYILEYCNKTTKENFIKRFSANTYNEAIKFVEVYMGKIRKEFPEEEYVVIELIQIQSISINLEYT